MKINLIDLNKGTGPYFNNHWPVKDLEYVGPFLKWDGITVFTDELCFNPVVDQIQSKHKIAWCIESPAIKSHFSNHIHLVENKFDYIYTYTPKSDNEKYKQSYFGACWIVEENCKIYEKTKLLSINPKRLVYPVPNPINPFLGVHTTITLNNELKIGPTAFPVIGKEQYRLIDGFNIKELFDFFISSTALLKSDSVNLLGLAKEEVMKLFTKPLLKRTRKLSSSLDSNKGWVKYPSGIRAQVINTKTKSIEMDYIVKADKNVVHILNAVSPGWTSSLPFARWVVENQPLLA
jgi:hypothetical protein